uniref:SFRICE_026276 n=1 Tax=Spodoptera frugiperda TaxID=7108 RepID=A0A2H1WAZ6_SPOFR
MKFLALALLALAAVATAKNIFVEDVIDLEDITAYGYLAKVGKPLADKIRVAEEEASASRIVGGQASSLGQFPYQAGLLADFSLGQGVCGGSLIKANSVLTAAHCWFDGQNQAWRFTVVLGSIRLFSGGTRVLSSNVVMHGSWTPNLIRNDVAVIKLSSNVALSDTIAVIALPSGSQLNENFAGAGITVNQFLSHVTLPVITNIACRASFPLIVQDSNICTSGAGGRSTCQGDSGGPLVVTRNNSPLLIGVTSFGSARGCQVGSPAAFARTFLALTLLALAAVATAKNINVEDAIDLEDITAYGYLAKIGKPLADEIRKAEEAEGASRIVGGQASNLGQFPYQAGLLADFSLGQGVCGGSLVRANRVLTAAHCWFDGQNQAWRFTVVLGSIRLFTGGTRVQTTNVVMHGSWNPSLIRNDVAMIRLNSNVGLSNTIALIALPSGSQLNENFAGENAVASGFGLTSGNISTNQFLSHVTLPVITNAVCRSSFPLIVQDSNICTSGAGGRSTCQGDSGGPLVVTRNNSPLLNFHEIEIYAGKRYEHS